MVDLSIDASGLLAQATQLQQQTQAERRADFARQLEERRIADGPAPSIQGVLRAPPGFVGALAQFIYQQAPRPVAEVAIVGALGLMAGIAGRDWSISGTGLNLYAVLVARSGIGKEAMHTGIGKVITAAMVKCPEVGTAVDFSDYASGPALIKAICQNPAFVNVAGEIGHKFLEMAEDKGGSPMRSYRKVLTDLYAKSGPGAVAGGISYSNQDCNVASVVGAAYSLIGETTPSKFYNSLTPSMMEDGFLSRFLSHRIVLATGPMKTAPACNGRGRNWSGGSTKSSAKQCCSGRVSSPCRLTSKMARRHCWIASGMSVITISGRLAMTKASASYGAERISRRFGCQGCSRSGTTRSHRASPSNKRHGL